MSQTDGAVAYTSDTVDVVNANRYAISGGVFKISNGTPDNSTAMDSYRIGVLDQYGLAYTTNITYRMNGVVLGATVNDTQLTNVTASTKKYTLQASVDGLEDEVFYIVVASDPTIATAAKDEKVAIEALTVDLNNSASGTAATATVSGSEGTVGQSITSETANSMTAAVGTGNDARKVTVTSGSAGGTETLTVTITGTYYVRTITYSVTAQANGSVAISAASSDVTTAK